MEKFGNRRVSGRVSGMGGLLQAQETACAKVLG